LLRGRRRRHGTQLGVQSGAPQQHRAAQSRLARERYRVGLEHSAHVLHNGQTVPAAQRSARTRDDAVVIGQLASHAVDATRFLRRVFAPCAQTDAHQGSCSGRTESTFTCTK
jgi:hypothetical protein